MKKISTQSIKQTIAGDLGGKGRLDDWDGKDLDPWDLGAVSSMENLVKAVKEDMARVAKDLKRFEGQVSKFKKVKSQTGASVKAKFALLEQVRDLKAFISWGQHTVNPDHIEAMLQLDMPDRTSFK